MIKMLEYSSTQRMVNTSLGLQLMGKYIIIILKLILLNINVNV